MKNRNIVSLGIVVGVLLFCSYAHAALDKYGGTTTLQCPSGPTAHFTTAKVTTTRGHQWVLCDPLGNAMIYKGVVTVVYNSTSYTTSLLSTKYTNSGSPVNPYTSGAQNYSYNWAYNAVSRLKLWGFNTLADGAQLNLWPTVTTGTGWTSADHAIPDLLKMPFDLGGHMTLYAMNNTAGCGLSSAIKDTMGAVGIGYFINGATGYNVPDFYDSHYATCVANVLLPANDPSGLAFALGVATGTTSAHNDYLVYVTIDEGDQTGFLNAGPDYPPLNDAGALAGSGFVGPNPAWIVLASSPAIARANNVKSVGTVNYSDAENYSKVKFANILATEYLCTAASTPLACCTGNKTGTCSVDPHAGAGTAITGANMTTATNALNTAWASSYTTLSTSDSSCTSNLATCLGGTPTYNSWGNGDCQASGAPLACCTGAGTGTCGSHGTGLLDEDGSEQYTGDPNTLGKSSDPQAYTTATFNKTVGETTAMKADMSALLTAYSTQYFSTITSAYNTQISTEVPGATILLQMKMGSFGSPPRAEVLQVGCQYLTLPQIEGAPPYSNFTIGSLQSRYDFVSTNCGNHPWMLWEGMHANPDSSENGQVRTDDIASTQAGRSSAYTSMVNACLTLKDTATGTYHCLGWYWWDMYDDHEAGGTNWGLVTESDNPYDGSATVAGGTVDPQGYTAVAEGVGSNPSTVPANYGNFISAVTTANTGVYSVIGGPAVPSSNHGPFTFIETWDEYGSQGIVPTIAPYVTIDPATQSILCGQTVPWNHPGQNLTGCYLRIVPSGHGGENPGPTVATRAGQLGNPSQTLITYTWFRAEVAPASNAAIFLWCDSTNPNQPPRGVDQSYVQLSHNGQLRLLSSSNTPLGNSGAFHLTFGTALTNWYLLESIITIGVNSAAAWQQGSVTLNIYQSNGVRVNSFGCTNCATNANNASLLIDQISFDAEFDNSIIEDFGPTWVINPGTNGITAFVGPQYSWFTTPAGDSTPLQYLVTGAATHHAAVSNVPPAPTKYVSTATQGNQDEYTANFPNDFDSITEQALVSFQESDVVGVRLGTDLSVSPGASTTTGNQCALTNGTYTFCESFYANPSMPTKIGLELGW